MGLGPAKLINLLGLRILPDRQLYPTHPMLLGFRCPSAPKAGMEDCGFPTGTMKDGVEMSGLLIPTHFSGITVVSYFIYGHSV